MTAAGFAAFAAGAVGVVAVWEIAAVVEHRAVAAWLVGERRRVAVLLAAVAGAAGWLVAGPLAAALGAGFAPWMLGRVVAVRRQRRREELAAAAPAVARGMADALAAGRSIRAAIASVAATHAELAAAAHALALGARTEDVLERLQARAASPAWDTIVAATLLQRDAGGDLASLLRAIAADLESTRRTEADARAATAQARMTARIVALLPAGAAVVGELTAPGTLARLLAEPLPATLVITAALLQATALTLVRRLAKP